MRITTILRVFSVVLLLCAFPANAESFLSIHGYPQTQQELPDYQIQTQVTEIINPRIQRILYPVFGFPAMITKNDSGLSFIIRNDSEPQFDYVRITRQHYLNNYVFADLKIDSVEKIGAGFYRVYTTVPFTLPSFRYDLTVKITGEEFEIISGNSIFFPAEKEGTEFYIWADPQIEDLQSKTAGDMNYNSGEYPGKSDSILDFSRQEGIISSTISQINNGNLHFVTMLGDLVFGINYQREYEDILNLILNLEVPFFPVPGNHDGYAKFVDQNNLTTDVDWDGLQYWAKFIGPLYYAFEFKEKTFLMLNTYDGTSVRRAAGDALGIGDNAAVPVSNWGGFLTFESLFWAENIIENNNVFGLFSHMMPLGQNATGKYHKMKKFPKESVIGVSDSQEWNIETSEWDSNPADMIFNETQTANTGVALAAKMVSQSPPPIYFSGHTHVDKIFTFESGDELVEGSGTVAAESTEFVMTTTAATSGSVYWGIRKVEVDADGNLNYSYFCDHGVNCRPTYEDEEQGFQSIPEGNIWTTYNWVDGEAEDSSIFVGGNGTSDTVSAEIMNYLPTDEDITLRFIMPPAEKGYKLDNKNFSITDGAVAKDLSGIVLTVQGSIAAGTTYEQFLAKDFTRKSEFVTISPSQEDVVTPEISYPVSIFENESISAKVTNSEKFLSLIWIRNNKEFAEGGDFSVMFEDYQSTETIFLVYVTKSGAAGRTQFETVVNAVIEEEPDEDVYEEPEEETVPDVDEVDGEETIDDEISDEENNKIKKSGCSVLML